VSIAPASAWAYGMSRADAGDDLEETRLAHGRIDFARQAMEGEIGQVRDRCREYLRWYSPPWHANLKTHDAWGTPLLPADEGLTRANYPIARAVVDIWTALEASAPVQIRAEPRRIAPPIPVLDEDQAQRLRLVYEQLRMVENVRATARSEGIRRWHRRSAFNYKKYVVTRKKNLYGFGWVKVLPDWTGKRPISHVLRDPTTVYPIWSDLDSGDTEAVLCVYEKNARWANQKYELGLKIGTDGRVEVGKGLDGQRLADQQYDSTRTMVMVEEFWWIDRTFQPREPREQTGTRVRFVMRVAGQIVSSREFPWRHLPFVYYENTDERDSYGWSDVAPIIDINDEFNRRMSQEGDIIGTASSPRFQLLGSLMGRQVSMPEPFELIALQDQERIEQILTRIDLFPTQQHFNMLTDLLHRVSGLPPIVWGLIANAQTSGRALTASWKATEARLAPRLMRNEVSDRRWIEIETDYAATYDWRGAKALYDEQGDLFDDWRLSYPPMEPRDFQEVTMNAITKRDAKLITTAMAMEETGEEAPEDVLEAVLAEAMNIALHPDQVNAYLMAKAAELDIQERTQQLEAAAQAGGQPGLAPNAAAAAGGFAAAAGGAPTPGAPPAPVGPGPFPPTQPGAAGNAGQAPGLPPGPGGPLEGSTLVRGGNVSTQLLSQSEF
jgi:hypothetical protein